MISPGEISKEIAKAFQLGQPIGIVSLVSDSSDLPPARLLVSEDGEVVSGSLGDGAEFDAAAASASRTVVASDREEIGVVEVEGRRLVVEVARPAQELIICGAGHVGQAVARAGILLGFKVLVIDDRPEFANRKFFPDEAVKLVAADFVESIRALNITRASHLVIVTRGHRHDEICLREVIESKAAYLGMIGSRRRTTTIRSRLLKEGISKESLERLRAPIGLDIGALTPEEIAVSIMAEIIMLRRGGAGGEKSAFLRKMVESSQG